MCLHFLGKIPRVAIIGLSDSYMLSFLSHCPVVLYSHQQCMNNPVFPHPYQHLVLSLFFNLSDRCVLIFHCSFILHFPNDVEQLFMCSFIICTSSMLKYLFMSFANFLLNCCLFSIFFFLLRFEFLNFVYSRY